MKVNSSVFIPPGAFRLARIAIKPRRWWQFWRPRGGAIYRAIYVFELGSPAWCEGCHRFHPKPRDFRQWEALNCQAPPPGPM